MSLFGHYQGKQALDCTYDSGIDAVASATGDKVYVHIANTDMHSSRQISLNIGKSATMHVIAADPKTEITIDHQDVFAVESRVIDPADFTLPAAAVAAIEIEL